MYQLPEMMLQTSHSALTVWLWGLAIILSAALFISLFSRRIAPAFPLFTNLIGYYLLRSVLLYVSFDAIDVEEYSRLNNFFHVLDILVMTGFAGELTHSLVVEAGGFNARRVLYIAGGILLAVLGSWGLVRLLPQASVQLDPKQIFFVTVAILIFIISFRSPNDLLRTIAQGWGMFGIISLSANIGRVLASAGGHPRRYAAWTYVFAGGHVVTVVFWLVALRSPVEHATPSGLKVPD